MPTALRLKSRWRELSRDDKILITLYEAMAIGISLWTLAEFNAIRSLATDWRDAVITALVVFGLFQLVLAVVISAIAAHRWKSRIQFIPKPTLKEQSKELFKGLIRTGLTFIVLIPVIFGVGYLADWLFPSSEWALKWRYSFEDGLTGATFIVATKPHDCEFLTAPLGGKNCHYKRGGQTIRLGRNGSARLVSYDEGKSWMQVTPADAPERPAVIVSWDKVLD